MRASRQAFTLLEIVLALALLAGALAALGEVLRMARESAEAAANDTQAQLLASSVMAELLSGARQAVEEQNALFDLDVDPPWQYSIFITPTQYSELVLVEVQIQQRLPAEKQPTAVRLQRWVLNPDLVEQLTAAAESASQSAAATGGT